MIIDGFTVDQMPRARIRAVLCQQVTIRNNRADRNGRWGILTGFCDDLLVENDLCSNSVAEHGIYVSNSGGADRCAARSPMSQHPERAADT